MLQIQDHDQLATFDAPKRLEILHDAAMSLLQMYASGLITLPELTESMTKLGTNIGDVTGLIDPATGLRM
jgi:hypothetical protein